ncbi:glycosyltransferase family 4 protein [Candidatus Nomurabacteria bacterium]|nr:glycosyltransferase family 4 protein [Candidatus Nomurabacteria bacterium]
MKVNSNSVMAVHKQKILFLITKSNFGGAQRYVYDLAIGLPKNEFEVKVASGGTGTLIDKLKAANIEVISIDSLQRDISLGKEWSAFWETVEIIRRERPDILHINSSKAGVLGSLAGRLLGIPNIIFTSHGWGFNEERPLWQRLIIKFGHWLTVLLAHRTIAVSQELKRQMNWPFVNKKITVIHNGRFITNLLTREDSRAALIEKDPRLAPYKDDFWSLTIGELHPVKRHNAVIEAMKEIVVREPKTRHLIISGGEEESRLRTLIEKQNLQENIFLLGVIDEASQYLKAADLFVLASRSEGMPYVLIEALLAGVPIVATKVGGIPEVVEDGLSGLLTPPLDNKALFEAIFELRTNPELRAKLSEGAKVRSQSFTFEKTLRETVALYSFSK